MISATSRTFIRIAVAVLFLTLAYIATQMYDPVGNWKYLHITPELSRVKFYDHLVEIPFTVRNFSWKDITISTTFEDGLYMRDDAGRVVSVRNSVERLVELSSGSATIRPGGSRECVAIYPERIFTGLQDRKFLVAMRGELAWTEKKFICYSGPFEPPSFPPAPALPEGRYDTVADTSGGTRFLTVEPILERATMDRDLVRIPFSLKNSSTGDIMIRINFDYIGGLYTWDDAGHIVSVRDFVEPRNIRYSGGPWSTILLHPGESHPCVAQYSAHLIAGLHGRRMFGGMRGDTGGERFASYSSPFTLPDLLSRQLWDDMGEQKFFSVTPQIDNAVLDGGSFSHERIAEMKDYNERTKRDWAHVLIIPIKVTNNSNQPCIAAVDAIAFHVVPPGAQRQPPLPWTIMQSTGPELKPGESADSPGSVFIGLNALASWNYKPGDKVVAGVGGRIPGTNKIFTCYSEPFELPPLPSTKKQE